MLLLAESKKWPKGRQSVCSRSSQKVDRQRVPARLSECDMRLNKLYMHLTRAAFSAQPLSLLVRVHYGNRLIEFY